jgi:hypothetical protein
VAGAATKPSGQRRSHGASLAEADVAASAADSNKFQHYDDLGSSCSGSEIAAEAAPAAAAEAADAVAATAAAAAVSAAVAPRLPSTGARLAHPFEADAAESLRRSTSTVASRRFELERDVAAAGAAADDRDAAARLEVCEQHRTQLQICTCLSSLICATCSGL